MNNPSNQQSNAYTMNFLLINPLLQLHQQNNAELQAYDQIEIVSTFGNPQPEYAAIHKSVGLLDLPQRGILEMTGKDRLAFLNNLVTNELWIKQTKSPMSAGKVSYNLLLNLKGRVVLDLSVIELPDRTLIDMDVRLVGMLVKLLDRYLFTEQVKLIDATDTYHQFALLGPKALEIVHSETSIADLPVGETIATRMIGQEIVLWRDDLCGKPGVMIVHHVPSSIMLWNHLTTRYGQEIELGKRLLRPVGWAAFNTTRIEAGRPLFGIDFELAEPSIPGAKSPADAETIKATGVLPAETGLFERSVSVTKGCYLGQEIVARMYARKQVARKIVGLRVEDGSLPIAGTEIYDDKHNQVGVITSSTMSPMLSDAAIALAFIKKTHFEEGTELFVPAEGAMRKAKVVPLPFT